MTPNVDRLVELRVHGVSGTTPEALLDRPLVHQVAGDRIAGFYRPRLVEERLDDRPNPFAPARPGAAELEGFNWGGLTSGSPGRAFWLLLLPFTLIGFGAMAGSCFSSPIAGMRWCTFPIALPCCAMASGSANGVRLNCRRRR